MSANNHFFPGFFAGFLGRAYDPFFVSDDPSVPGFSPFPAATGSQDTTKLRQRHAMLAALQADSRPVIPVPAVRDFDRYHQQALALVASPPPARPSTCR